MKERDLYAKFKLKMKARDPQCWIYKIPDFLGGGKRPFDIILVSHGIPWAIEMKSKGKDATLYQAYQLLDFELAGGKSAVFKYGEDMDALMERITK